VLKAGVPDLDGEERYCEEVSEFCCEKSEMVRPRNNVLECDNSCNLILNADNARIMTTTKDLVVPVDDHMIVKVYWCGFPGGGQGESCNPIENVRIIHDDQVMSKPLWQ
jgi:hypothetical protein